MVFAAKNTIVRGICTIITMKIELNKKVAIWGTGKIGTRIYQEIKDRYTITCFIETNPSRITYFEKPVYRLLEAISPDLFVIIATSAIEEVEAECRKHGLVFAIDYIAYNYIVSPYRIPLLKLINEIQNPNKCSQIIKRMIGDKQTILILGNCQVEVILNYMALLDGFHEQYVIIDIPAIHLFRDKNLFFENIKCLEDLNILITQDISSNNEFDERFSTDSFWNIISNVTNNKAKRIIIPNLFFDVYFPQGGKMPNRNNVMLDKYGAGVFPYPDYIIDDLVRRYDKDKVIDIVMNPDFISEQFMDDYSKYRFCQLKQREEKCDVKILDYVIENYKRELLFFSRNHPKNKVIRVMVARLAGNLGLSGEFLRDIENEVLKTWQEWIYPSVAKTLELEFEKKLYSDGQTDNEEICLHDIMNKYIEMCHGR